MAAACAMAARCQLYIAVQHSIVPFAQLRRVLLPAAPHPRGAVQGTVYSFCLMLQLCVNGMVSRWRAGSHPCHAWPDGTPGKQRDTAMA